MYSMCSELVMYYSKCTIVCFEQFYCLIPKGVKLNCYSFLLGNILHVVLLQWWGDCVRFYKMHCITYTKTNMVDTLSLHGDKEIQLSLTYFSISILSVENELTKNLMHCGPHRWRGSCTENTSRTSRCAFITFPKMTFSSVWHHSSLFSHTQSNSMVKQPGKNLFLLHISEIQCVQITSWFSSKWQRCVL